MESGGIYENYLRDYEEALVSYLDGHEWSHAVRLLSTCLRHRTDLFVNEFLSAFTNVYDDVYRQIRTDYERFQTYVERLTCLRTNLFQHIKQLLDAGRDYDFDNNDDQSEQDEPGMNDDRRTIVTRAGDETGSIRTRLSKKSGSISSSKKSQRRAAQQQEKLVQLKQGSKHEDLAIVRELWLLITKFDKLNGDIRHINQICYQISTQQNSLIYEHKGEHLQNQYHESINAMDKQLASIWLNNTEQQDNVQFMIISKKIREKFRKELDLVSNQYRVPPVLVSKTSQWKLVVFESDATV
jgi:hypothetical protein